MTDLGPWEPATPAEVASLFSHCSVPWWIAGGYAIEFAIGHPIRAHDDIDILLLRPDQLVVQQILAGWEWWAADPPGTLRPWLPGETLPPDVHDIWCRPAADEPWRIQFMLDECVGTQWVSRRDANLRRPVAELGRVNVDGIPYLTPDIQLFYKSRQRRPKDEIDFAAVLPVLTKAEQDWLADALPAGHPWHERLNSR